MPPDNLALAPRDIAGQGPWGSSLARLAAASTVLFALTYAEWREMAHQWWDIDTYAHILLIPPILVWLVWLRRTELAKVAPTPFGPGLAIVAGGLTLWLAGRASEINLVAQLGAVVSCLGAIVTILGSRVTLIIAFPLAYALFLVPFGDEIVAPLQEVTARIAVALTHVSGVTATLNGLFVDTPAGRFIVAEECSGVKFLIAMIALATLVAWTSFASWRKGLVFVAAAAFTSIIANGIRAWATIFVAQYVGAERAGGFDHIVYGWLFFGAVIGLVLAGAWRFFDREPAEAGYSATEADAVASLLPKGHVEPRLALGLLAAMVAVFAVLARLV